MLSEERVLGGRHAPEEPPLPKTTTGWVLCVLVALGALGFGAYCFTEQTFRGFIITGLRNPGYGSAAWGLYIAFDVIFVGISFAGITVAAICRLFEIAILRPVTRMAELLTITVLLGGAAVVVADLGRPLDGLLKLPRYANPSSPFYGTFTLVVAGYMFSSLVYFFLAGRADAAHVAADARVPGRWFYRLWASGYRDTPGQQARHRQVSFWLALTILPLLVTAHSTLGFIFGLQSGRPGWYSALMAPGFVVMAGVSGTGMLILLGLGFRRLFKLHDKLPDASFRWLGNFVWVLSLVYLYFMIVEELTATYAGPEADRHLAHQIVGGPFAPLFWTTAICLFLSFLIPFLMYVTRRFSAKWLALVGVLANVAAVLKRFLIVVPSQTHGSLMPVEPPKMYQPTWIEYGVICGLVGLVLTAQLLFGRFFPLVPSDHGHPEKAPQSGGKRRLATLSVAMAALGLIVVGLTDSFRLWNPPNDFDPRIPFSAVIFAKGVMLLFISAVVYELWPERKRTPNELWIEHKSSSSLAIASWRGEVPTAPAPIRVSDFRQLTHLAAMAEETAIRKDPRRARELAKEVEQLAASIAKK